MQLTTEFHRVNAHGVTQSFNNSVQLRVAFNSVLLRGKKSSKAFAYREGFVAHPLRGRAVRGSASLRCFALNRSHPLRAMHSDKF
jgi:hypothetical protein